MSLFPSESVPSRQWRDPSGARVLIQFRAGKIDRDGKMAKPDPRKGLLTIEKTPDTLVHLKWKDRTTNAEEVDLILLPNEATFVRVPQCTTGRVFAFVLDYGHFLFWMQEPNAAKDDEILRRVNEVIVAKNPPRVPTATAAEPATPAVSSGPTATPAAPVAARNIPVESRGSGAGAPVRVNMSPAPSASDTTAGTAAASSAATASSSGPLSQLALQDILSKISVPSEGSSEAQQADLGRVLTVENVSRLLSKPEVLESVFPFIPPKAARTKEEVLDIIRSPQFKQAVATLNHGLQTGQLASFVAQLGLDPSVGGPLGGVEAFIEAIRLQAEAKKKRTGASDDAMQE